MRTTGARSSCTTRRTPIGPNRVRLRLAFTSVHIAHLCPSLPESCTVSSNIQFCRGDECDDPREHLSCATVMYSREQSRKSTCTHFVLQCATCPIWTASSAARPHGPTRWSSAGSTPKARTAPNCTSRYVLVTHYSFCNHFFSYCARYVFMYSLCTRVYLYL